MIVNSLCNTCFTPFELMFEPSDVALVKQIADEQGFTCPCPRLCGGAINLIGDPTIKVMANDPRLKPGMRLTGKELYRAVNGAGLPDEIPQSGELVESLLKAHKVLDAEIEVAEGQVYIHSIELANGVVIHLSAGRRGAKILKVTKRSTHENPSGSTATHRA